MQQQQEAAGGQSSSATAAVSAARRPLDEQTKWLELVSAMVGASAAGGQPLGHCQQAVLAGAFRGQQQQQSQQQAFAHQQAPSSPTSSSKSPPLSPASDSAERATSSPASSYLSGSAASSPGRAPSAGRTRSRSSSPSCSPAPTDDHSPAASSEACQAQQRAGAAANCDLVSAFQDRLKSVVVAAAAVAAAAAVSASASAPAGPQTAASYACCTTAPAPSPLAGCGPAGRAHYAHHAHFGRLQREQSERLERHETSLFELEGLLSDEEPHSDRLDEPLEETRRHALFGDGHSAGAELSPRASELALHQEGAVFADEHCPAPLPLDLKVPPDEGWSAHTAGHEFPFALTFGLPLGSPDQQAPVQPADFSPRTANLRAHQPELWTPHNQQSCGPTSTRPENRPAHREQVQNSAAIAPTTNQPSAAELAHLQPQRHQARPKPYQQQSHQQAQAQPLVDPQTAHQDPPEGQLEHQEEAAETRMAQDQRGFSCSSSTSNQAGNNTQGGRSSSGGKSKHKRLYKCRHCRFETYKKNENWQHARKHIKPDKLLSCGFCEFVTEYKHHLEYHLRNHSGLKPFKCSNCDYHCVNKSMLNSHMKSHSSVYQYQCGDCKYATKYVHSLKMHLRKYKHQPTQLMIDVYGRKRGPRSTSSNGSGGASESKGGANGNSGSNKSSKGAKEKDRPTPSASNENNHSNSNKNHHSDQTLDKQVGGELSKASPITADGILDLRVSSKLVYN